MCLCVCVYVCVCVCYVFVFVCVCISVCVYDGDDVHDECMKNDEETAKMYLFKASIIKKIVCKTTN